MIDLNNYYIYENKDGRLRAYNKTTHKVTSYPRVLMEAILGRPLLPTEDVHHIDENPRNNDPSNLEVIDHREHDSKHATKYYDKKSTCPICGKVFLWTSKQQRMRNGNANRKQPRIPLLDPCCSKSCAGKASAITAKIHNKN